MERKKLELILDQVAAKWFIGVEGPSKNSRSKDKIAQGKAKTWGFPQLMELRRGRHTCPHCGTITAGSSKINLKTDTQIFECGCKRPFFRL